MCEGILCGHCWTIGNGTVATPFDLDCIMWTTKTTLQGSPRLRLNGLKVFLDQELMFQQFEETFLLNLKLVNVNTIHVSKMKYTE